MHHFYSKVLLLLTFLVFHYVGHAQSSGQNDDLLAAFNAQGSLQLKESNLLFKKVVSDTNATKEDRCRALRQLAIQDWKFYKNYETAIEKLDQAEALGAYASETWIVRNRVEVGSKNFEKALMAAKRSIELSASKADKVYATYKYCQTLLRQALYLLKANKPIDRALLLDASQRLQDILAKRPTHVHAAETLLGIALLCEDGPLALQAWLSYFRFASVESVYAYLQPVATSLQKILPKWSNSPLRMDQTISLAQSLGKSGFYNYASALVKPLRGNVSLNEQQRSSVQNIMAYYDYLRDVKDFTNEHYRKTTIDAPISDDYTETLLNKSEQLFQVLMATEEKKDTFSFRNFRELVSSKYGTILMLGQTSSSNVPSLIMGQIVNERIRSVTQYGHSADFNFTELDMMISNGYPSWFWEDRGAGGFAISGGFIRVKTMFKYLGIEAWGLVTDSIKRGKHLKKINTHLTNATLDSSRNSIYLGVASKLELDALDAIYNELLLKNFEGLELQLKFIETYDSYRDNATMFAHEGRHSLDRIVLGDEYRALGTPTIEYRARLSQIAFSEAPKLELANMLNGVGNSGAGLSNKMIVEVAEDWIAKNSSKITEFDASKPPLTQLFRMTDAQIKSCYREVDPFYQAQTKE
ncbi:MAG: hypothetical protein AAF489_01935 [Bacteroidota bacterium]